MKRGINGIIKNETPEKPGVNDLPDELRPHIEESIWIVLLTFRSWAVYSNIESTMPSQCSDRKLSKLSAVKMKPINATTR